MIAFTRLTGLAAPLLRDNIDTDAIISARAMEGGGRPLGQLVFTNWRLDEQGRERPEFVLNQPRYRHACFIVAGRNFGCGSSRESAVWALMQFGVRAVIASSYGDIFYENALQNGLLPVRVELEAAERLAQELETAAEPRMTVDLERQVVVGADGLEHAFQLDPERRRALMFAKDDFSLLRDKLPAIKTFEAVRRRCEPWLFETPCLHGRDTPQDSAPLTEIAEETP